MNEPVYIITIPESAVTVLMNAACMVFLMLMGLRR